MSNLLCSSTLNQTLSDESNCTSCFSRIEGIVGAKPRLGLLLSGGGARKDFQKVTLELNLEKVNFSSRDVMGQEDWSVLESASSFARQTGFGNLRSHDEEIFFFFFF